jgi:hypothetical protein
MSRILHSSDDERLIHADSGHKKRRIISCSDSDDIDADAKCNDIDITRNTLPLDQSSSIRSSVKSRKKQDFESNDPIKTLSDCLLRGRRPLSSRSILETRKELYLRSLSIVGHENFETIDNRKLSMIYQLINELFLFGCLDKVLQSERRSVTFRISNRMTSRAGQLLTNSSHRNRHELSISSHLICHAFSNSSSMLDRPISVNGVTCRNRLDCLLRVVEHEVVHLILCSTSICTALGVLSTCDSGHDRLGCQVQGESYHGPTFQRAARNLFGHSDWTHDLITTQEIALDAHGIEVGTKVKFTVEGERHTGVVNRVQKRATVLVKDSSVDPHQDAREFSDGFFYRKFYVPLNHLTPVL